MSEEFGPEESGLCRFCCPYCRRLFGRAPAISPGDSAFIIAQCPFCQRKAALVSYQSGGRVYWAALRFDASGIKANVLSAWQQEILAELLARLGESNDSGRKPDISEWVKKQFSDPGDDSDPGGGSLATV